MVIKSSPALLIVRARMPRMVNRSLAVTGVSESAFQTNVCMPSCICTIHNHKFNLIYNVCGQVRGCRSHLAKIMIEGVLLEILLDKRLLDLPPTIDFVHILSGMNIQEPLLAISDSELLHLRLSPSLLLDSSAAARLSLCIASTS